MGHSHPEFDALPWETVGAGLRNKQIAHGGKLLRLVEFSEGYDDTLWCEKGHSGVVLEGRFTLIYDSGEVELRVGGVLQIEPGAADRHRARVAPGQRALLFLVEDSPPG